MRSGIVETIHYEQPNSRISAGDPLPSSQAAGSLREIHYQAAEQPDLCGRSTTSSQTAGSLREIHYLHASAFFFPCVFASLRLFLYDSRNEVSLMRGPTGNSHQRSPPCGSEQEALSSAAQASAAPRDAYP